VVGSPARQGSQRGEHAVHGSRELKVGVDLGASCPLTLSLVLGLQNEDKDSCALAPLDPEEAS
jgi:hypothetical protein